VYLLNKNAEPATPEDGTHIVELSDDGETYFVVTEETHEGLCPVNKYDMFTDETLATAFESDLVSIDTEANQMAFSLAHVAHE
jgi:hypothetical protein